MLVPKMPNRIYMQITQDSLQLPTAIADSPKELAEITGAKHQSIITIASKARHGKKIHPSFVGVDIEPELSPGMETRMAEPVPQENSAKK